MKSLPQTMYRFGVLAIAAAFCASANAADWYLRADNPANADWSTLANWYSSPVGGTNPTAMSSADTYHINGRLLRSPLNSTDVTFPGGTLVMDERIGATGGDRATTHIGLKCRNSTAVTTIPNLVCKGGASRVITNMSGGILLLNINNMTVSDDEVTTFSTDTAAKGLNVTLGTISGNGGLSLIGGGTTILKINNGSNLRGGIFLTGSTQLTVANNFTTGGSLVIEQGSRVVLNGNVTVTSLIVNGTTDQNQGFLGLINNGTKFNDNATYSFAALNAAFPAIFTSGTGSITVTRPAIRVDVGQVIRPVPLGQLGINSGYCFETLTPDYGTYMKKAKIGMARIGCYPIHGGTSESLAAVDMNIIRHLNCGVQPTFLQVIRPPSATTFYNSLYNLDGVSGPGSGATPATNIAYLVKHFMAPPFNMTTQYWEVHNEPDISVTYKVASSQEYINYYQSIHDQLVASGVRGNVRLCGPVTAFEHGFNANGGWTDVIMRDFLTACAGPRNGYNQIDVVTRHVYAAIYDWETGAPKTQNTAYNLLNAPTEMVTFTPAQVKERPYSGEGGLLQLMNSLLIPKTTGTGITEMNVPPEYRGTITQGLWFLTLDHYSLYNPRCELGAGFIYSRADSDLGYFKGDKTPNMPYWATWIHGNLTGDEIVAQSSSDPHLLATASKDERYVYLQVINRGLNNITASVAVSNASVSTPATMFELTSTALPDVPVSTNLGTSFTYTFPAMTARVFRYLRTNAPPEVTLPPPANELLSTSFAAAPAGMQVYTDSATFTPNVSNGELIITTNKPNIASAVVFNGTPLPSAQNRAQARFGFRIESGHAMTGFVFGAYSSSPQAVGGAGPGLGYYNQANRLWGVKICNYMSGRPHQIGIVGSVADQNVTGWAVRALPTYAPNIEVYAVIDYDGNAGTVRARLYQGTDDTGILWADITNTLLNPATLPAGTVFGFTGSTQGYSQITKIHDLLIKTDNITPGGLPAPWKSGDVGVFAPAGTASAAGGTFTVTTGNGVDFSAAYTSDKFTYVSQAASGDCSIVSRVASIHGSDTALSEAAVMIRETTGTTSKFAAIGITDGRGAKFTHRTTDGSANVSITGTGKVDPYWVRLTRVGDVFTGYMSPDGVTWTQLGSQTIPMSASTKIGLAVCDHGVTVIGTGVFDNVAVNP